MPVCICACRCTRAHPKHTCTPLCANYLSSVRIWLGCAACSPWARPGDIQAKINTRQLLGARDILVINSCVGLYNREPPPPPPPTPAIPPEQAVSFQMWVWQAKAGSHQRRCRWETWRGEAVAQSPGPSPARRPLALPGASCASLVATTAKPHLIYSRFLESVEE